MSTQTEFKSNQGQQAAPLRLSYEDMTDNERALVGFLDQEDRPVFTIKEIMEGLNWHRGPGGRAKGNSRVRNTLRRLVRAKWLSHPDEVGDGKYRLSVQGKNRLDKLVEEAGEKKTSAAPKKHKAAPKKDETKAVLAKLAAVGLTPADVAKVANEEQEF